MLFDDFYWLTVVLDSWKGDIVRYWCTYELCKDKDPLAWNITSHIAKIDSSSFFSFSFRPTLSLWALPFRITERPCGPKSRYSVHCRSLEWIVHWHVVGRLQSLLLIPTLFLLFYYPSTMLKWLSISVSYYNSWKGCLQIVDLLKAF